MVLALYGLGEYVVAGLSAYAKATADKYEELT